MRIWYRVLLVAVIVIAAALFFRALVGSSTIAIFQPAGAIASYQRDLIRNAILLMLIIVVPFLAVFYTFAWKYRARAGDEKDVRGTNAAKIAADEKPRGFWKQIWLWVLPAVIVAGLAVLGWQGAHAVDPFSPIAADGANGIAAGTQTVNIQVVALQWKWLFIYPQQNIATVNFVEFPENTPVHFTLTADGPISSFWIPQLGSQIYAMAAMSTQLNLEADRTGEFVGKDTEINGAGYAGMQFEAKSVAQPDFDAWVASVQGMGATTTLDANAYNSLLTPSQNNPPQYFSSVEPGLFDGIMMKYMMPSSSMMTESSSEAMPSMPSMPGMEM